MDLYVSVQAWTKTTVRTDISNLDENCVVKLTFDALMKNRKFFDIGEEVVEEESRKKTNANKKEKKSLESSMKLINISISITSAS